MEQNFTNKNDASENKTSVDNSAATKSRMLEVYWKNFTRFQKEFDDAEKEFKQVIDISYSIGNDELEEHLNIIKNNYGEARQILDKIREQFNRYKNRPVRLNTPDLQVTE